MARDVDLSIRLRRAREQAVREREARDREAASQPKLRFNQRKKWVPPPPLRRAETVTGVGASLSPLAGFGTLAPVCCRRSRWSDRPASHALCPGALGMTGTLHVAYAAWAEHHATCPTCRTQDWDSPGAPVRVTDKLLADTTLVVDGKPVYYRFSPDPSVLCRDGRAMFEHWMRQAAVARNKRDLTGEEG